MTGFSSLGASPPALPPKIEFQFGVKSGGVRMGIRGCLSTAALLCRSIRSPRRTRGFPRVLPLSRAAAIDVLTAFSIAPLLPLPYSSSIESKRKQWPAGDNRVHVPRFEWTSGFSIFWKSARIGTRHARNPIVRCCNPRADIGPGSGGEKGGFFFNHRFIILFFSKVNFELIIGWKKG